MQMAPALLLRGLYYPQVGRECQPKQRKDTHLARTHTAPSARTFSGIRGRDIALIRTAPTIEYDATLPVASDSAVMGSIENVRKGSELSHGGKGMTPAPQFDISALSAEQKLELLKAMLPGMDVKSLTEVKGVVKDVTAKRSKEISEEAVALFEKNKAALVATVTSAIEGWIATNDIKDSVFSMSKVQIADGKFVGAIEFKVGKTGGVSITPGAARGTYSLEGKVGKVSKLEANGTTYKTWADVLKALNVPMPERESATRTLVKVAGAKAGQVSGGETITQAMIDSVRAVKVTAEKTGEMTLGEIVDEIKKESGNGTAPAAAPASTPSA